MNYSKSKVGEIIEAKDWNNHPLGKPEHWPPALKISLANMLASKFPKFMFWGRELFCFYNDAFIQSIEKDKHPKLIGQMAKDGWPEAWDFIKENTDRVFDLGESTWYENFLLPIYREGVLKNVYWTFSHSPIYDEDGKVCGVLVTNQETTKTIETVRSAIEDQEKLFNLLMQAPIAICLLEGPEFIFTIANEPYLQFIQKTEEDVIHKKLWEVLPEAKNFIEPIISNVYKTGIPFYGNELYVPLLRNNVMEDAWFNFVYTPLKDAAGNVLAIFAMASEVTELIKTRQKISIEEKRYRDLANFIPDFIWTTDLNGISTYQNDSFIKYTGLSLEQLNKNGGWEKIIHPEDLPDNLLVWTAAMEAKKIFVYQHRFLNADGKYQWFLSRGLPVLDGDGNVLYWLGSSTDIDKIKQEEKLRNDFIKMASHELKTPVTTIKGYVQLLLSQSGEKDPIISHSLKTVHKQVDKLTALITDLLDVTKTEIGNLSFNIQEKNLVDELKMIVRDFSAFCEKHQISLDTNGMEDVKVRIDHDRFTQVINNVLSNAVKYSPEADKIDIFLHKDGEYIVITIRDYGIGINKEEHDKIFERFYRVSGKDESTYPGFGIGLYIVKEILKQLKGKITVDGAPGEGSSFSIALPVINRG